MQLGVGGGLERVNMGFSHVLPSNAGLQTFPNNNASSYSTPLQKPYNLKGNWEVGLRNVTYSGCVNTFHEDVIKVGRKYSTPEMCKTVEKPLVFQFSPTKTTPDLMKEINTSLKGLIELKLDKKEKHCSWKMLDKNFCVGISEDLKKRFYLWSDVITTYDFTLSNYTPFSGTALTKVSDSDKEKLFLVLLPLKYKHTKWIVKAANENITIETLVQRFNARVEGLELKYHEKKKKFVVYKACRSNDWIHCYETIHLLSPGLLLALGLRKGGLFQGDRDSKYMGHDFTRHFKEEWFVAEYVMNEASDVNGYVDTVISLKSQAFADHESAVHYLNTLHESIEFKINDETHFLTLNIKEKVRIHFSDILMDCLAFDKSDYIGPGKFTATGEFSLTRRIKYLYIYTNLIDFVRIGDTEAPLLGIVPFMGDNCKILKEKTFEDPMFVPLRSNFVTQIDVTLRDGAGEIIPFLSSASTSLCIYLREV